MMMDADMLKALQDERDHAVFARRAEAFVKRWAPLDLREQWEFTGELMSLFRDMILTQQHVHQQVATRYYKENMTTLSMVARPPLITPKDGSK